MYRTCPRCGHERGAEETGDADRCPACGLIFSKYLKTRYRAERPRDRSLRTLARYATDDRLTRLKALLLPEPEQRPTEAAVYGRMVLWLFFAVWGLRLVWIELDSNAIGRSFLHNVHLMFHEAGHALFRIFGQFMMYLGGSLMQLIVPATFVGAFLRMRNPFGAAIALWWLGTSLMDLAPYIADARAMQLTLLGGGTGRDRPGMHDWNEILAALGLLEWDRALAWCVDVTGELVVLGALAWAAVVVARQWQQLKKPSS